MARSDKGKPNNKTAADDEGAGVTEIDHQDNALSDVLAEALSPVLAVRLDRDGVKNCGPYKSGTIYEVGEPVAGDVVLTNEEANRLITDKGFTELKTLEGLNLSPSLKTQEG